MPPQVWDCIVWACKEAEQRIWGEVFCKKGGRKCRTCASSLDALSTRKRFQNTCSRLSALPPIWYTCCPFSARTAATLPCEAGFSTVAEVSPLPLPVTLTSSHADLPLLPCPVQRPHQLQNGLLSLSMQQGSWSCSLEAKTLFS